MPSDVIDWARWLGLSAIAMTVLLLLYILLLRGWIWLMDRRRQRLWQHWRPLCMNTVCGLTSSDPQLPLEHRNWLLFFRLWHHYLLNVQGEARDNLRRFGRQMGLHHIVIKILIRASTDRESLAATVATGWLRDIRAWEPLLNSLYAENSVLSFASARSLARIDPKTALPIIIPQISKRPDWSKHLIAGLLLELGPELVSAPLLDAIGNAPAEQITALIRFLRFADVSTGNAVLFRYMPTTQDPELLSACLKAAYSPRVLPLIRDRLSDSHWTVRVEAANALSRLGNSDDVNDLLPLLTDQQWWVRYRAAQAIGELLRRDKDKIASLSQAQTDRYATDMLAQVVAEWG